MKPRQFLRCRLMAASILLSLVGISSQSRITPIMSAVKSVPRIEAIPTKTLPPAENGTMSPKPRFVIETTTSHTIFWNRSFLDRYFSDFQINFSPHPTVHIGTIPVGRKSVHNVIRTLNGELHIVLNLRNFNLRLFDFFQLLNKHM